MARTKVHTTADIKDMNTLRLLVAFMIENDYVPGGHREGAAEYTIAKVQKEGEHWYSNGHNEFKIITSTGPYGGITLRNFRSLIGPKVDDLFASIAD